MDQVDEIQQAAGTIRHELEILDQRLASVNWLVGNAISAADIAIFPMIQLILRAAAKEAAQPFKLQWLPLATYYPNLAKWVGRIEALPNYQRTYPPHWRA